MRHTKMHFSAKCNSGRIAIQWFHMKHYLDYQYTKFQPYTFRVQKMCVFARYATLVPRLLNMLNCKYSVESFRDIMPEFESNFFFLFSISFCSSRKLEFLMLYTKAFFSIWSGLNSFAAKQTPYRCSADANDP